MTIALQFQPKFVGQAIPRVEDPLLLTGRVQCVDDLDFPGMLHMAFLRSPHAHARIVAVDTAAARQVPGVEYVLTGDELRQHLGPLGGFQEGWQGYALAVGKVRYVGEPVAAVVATSRYVAEDAAEQIRVEYEPLPPVVDPYRALEADAPLLYEEQGTNVIFKKTYRYGDPDRAIASADLVVRGTFRFPRVSANTMETNGCISQYNPLTNEVTIWGPFQILHHTQMGFSAALRLPPNRVRVVAMPHGASFGSRGALGKYCLIAAIASKLLDGRPVKYIEDRLEHLAASVSHAWDRRYEAEFGFTRDGRCVAMKISLLNDIGASSEGLGPTMALKPLVCLTGPYRVQDVEYEVTAVVTSKCPEGGYRGYGPPPHFLVIERMMDKAAEALGMDRVEIRRRNFIQPDEFPYTTPTGVQYDSGNYPEVLRVALETANYEELKRQRDELRAQGRLSGVSVVFGIEPGGAWGFPGPYHDFGPLARTPMPDIATIRVDLAGQIEVELYQTLEGQGQYTIAAQVVADYFGVPLQAVRVVQAEPNVVPPSFGPGGSRQAVTLTSALLGAADRLREKLVKVAAHLLEVAEDDLELRDGAIRVRGAPERALTLQQLVGVMAFRPDRLPGDVDANPEATYVWNAPGRSLDDPRGSPYLTFANACHIVWVDIDPGTGKVQILRYILVDDCGTRLNPAIVEGITQGGVAQGIGCALLEEYVYDEQGNLLTGTYMDYLLPSVYEVPLTEKRAVVTPSPFTPLGVKGAGEGAIHVAPAAVFCAINDALAPLGVELTEIPATPERLWRLIRQAQERGRATTTADG